MSHIDDFDGVCLWKYDTDAFSYDLEYGIRNLEHPDFQSISHILSLYLLGQNEKGQHGNTKIAYGKFVFATLNQYISAKVMFKKAIPLQPFYVIRDHLATIDMLIKLLKQHGFSLSDTYDYNQIISEWDGIIHLVIKHNVISNMDNHNHAHEINADKHSKYIDLFEQRQFAIITNIMNISNEIIHNNIILQ